MSQTGLEDFSFSMISVPISRLRLWVRKDSNPVFVGMTSGTIIFNIGSVKNVGVVDTLTISEPLYFSKNDGFSMAPTEHPARSVSCRIRLFFSAVFRTLKSVSNCIARWRSIYNFSGVLNSTVSNLA